MKPLSRFEKRMWRRVFGLLAIGALAVTAWGQPFQATLSRPALDRWMYPFNATPGTRPAASVFGTLGDASGVDSRHGQFLLKFDLGGVAAADRGPDRYLVKKARLSLVVSRDKAYPLDPTEDPMASYLEPDAPGYVADQDPARPVEVFGVGFRNGFSAETFLEDSPFGSSAAGGRNAYAAGPNPAGRWVDVGNSVGKTNEVFPVFDTRPLALGQVEGWPSGEPVPAGLVMTFDLDLGNPWVAGYVQMALHTGRLWLAVTSLHESGFGGAPTFAEFFTQDSALGVPPSLAIEGTRIRDEDSDGDGLPDDWERFYWGDLSAQAGGDDDGDGITHEVEYRTGTSPRNASDALRVMAVREAHGGIRLEFGHQPNSRYRIQTLSDDGQWVEVTDGNFQHDLQRGRVAWKEANPGVWGSRRSHRLYRVMVEKDDGRGVGGGF
jgi:hypothetical protein